MHIFFLFFYNISKQNIFYLNIGFLLPIIIKIILQFTAFDDSLPCYFILSYELNKTFDDYISKFSSNKIMVKLLVDNIKNNSSISKKIIRFTAGRCLESLALKKTTQYAVGI